MEVAMSVALSSLQTLDHLRLNFLKTTMDPWCTFDLAPPTGHRRTLQFMTGYLYKNNEGYGLGFLGAKCPCRPHPWIHPPVLYCQIINQVNPFTLLWKFQLELLSIKKVKVTMLYFCFNGKQHLLPLNWDVTNFIFTVRSWLNISKQSQWAGSVVSKNVLCHKSTFVSSNLRRFEPH